MSTDFYDIDISSLRSNFPAEIEIPSLLLEFAKWVSRLRWGSVGYFNIEGERFDDYRCHNGSDLSSHFVLFMHLPDGSCIGYWLYQGRTIENAPIVFISSEGEYKVLANSLEDFLFLIASNEINTYGIYDLMRDEESNNADARPQLIAWLETYKNAHPTKQVDAESTAHPNLEEWLNNWCEAQRDLASEEPLYEQISEILHNYIPQEEWETANFDVLIVGSRFEMWQRNYEKLPVPEASALEPLFRSLREQRAYSLSERGLWFSAGVTLDFEGIVSLSCDFLDEPKFVGMSPTLADYKADLQAFPRSDYWMSSWLEKCLQAS